jgi:hypothetical protein
MVMSKAISTGPMTDVAARMPANTTTAPATEIRRRVNGARLGRAEEPGVR